MGARLLISPVTLRLPQIDEHWMAHRAWLLEAIKKAKAQSVNKQPGWYVYDLRAATFDKILQKIDRL